MTHVDAIAAPGCGCEAADPTGGLVSIDEALRRIAATTRPVAETRILPPGAARGSVLAAAVRAPGPTPPFDNAAMDGYAVDTAALAGEGPWTLEVTGRMPAGQAPGARIAGPAACRIFTGAPLPAGADAVVMQEAVHRTGNTIRLESRPVPGLNIRRAGSDIAGGDTVLTAGRRLGPREIAACAAAGARTVGVRRPVRVALLVTGDEVRRVGAARGPAQIWDVNTPMLAAALARPGVDLIGAAVAADDRDGLSRQLAELAQAADLVVTTGGISVGEEDHVRPALHALGAAIRFSGVAMKPGKPLSFGHIGRAAWLGLPGNPLSAFVAWQLFGLPLLRQLAGETATASPRRHVVTDRDLHHVPGRCEIRPARIVGFDGDGREVVTCEDAVHSHRIAGLWAADGLILLPADIDALPAGGLVEFLPAAEC